MKKIKLLTILTVVVLITAVILCLVKCSGTKQISITKESYYSDYFVNNDKVRIYCHVTINNPFNRDIKVKLKASFSDDTKLGLLKESELFGFSKDEKSDVFVLPANSTKSFDIVFIGNFGGVHKKSNRLLPEISIMQI